VQNTLTLSTSPEQGGNGVVIDANSGEVIENYGWACQP
jgi:hypothetical protein